MAKAKKAVKETVDQATAEDAVRVLLRWAGEDPAREGLRDTPRRVVAAYRDWYSGYGIDPREYLQRTFEETAGYDEMVVLRDIEFESHCEHHMAPIIGRAHVGYLPTNKVVGISKLARVVDAYARRFQVQEKMTAEIAALHQHGAEAARRRRRGRGRARMHDDAWCPQARRLHDHQQHARHLPQRCADPQRVPHLHRNPRPEVAKGSNAWHASVRYEAQERS